MQSATEVIDRMGDRLDGMARRLGDRYRVDREDMRAEVAYLVMMAVGRYTPDRGELDDWVAFYVWRRLKSAARGQARWKARHGPLAAEPGREVQPFDLRDLRLGKDARAVAEAVLSGRVSLEVATAGRGKADRLREMVRIHFLVRDWSLRRVRRAFVELREALA